jgi:hypothetical protein
MTAFKYTGGWVNTALLSLLLICAITMGWALVTQLPIVRWHPCPPAVADSLALRTRDRCAR